MVIVKVVTEKFERIQHFFNLVTGQWTLIMMLMILL